MDISGMELKQMTEELTEGAELILNITKRCRDEIFHPMIFTPVPFGFFFTKSGMERHFPLAFRILNLA